MSFFSSGASRHNPSAPGFSHHDPFASLSNRNEDDADALDFEDTYDGLGDQLEETGDAFNDDTFGDSAGPGNIGKDFDFFASTAKVANVIEAEHSRYGRSQQQPAKTQESPAPSTSRIVPQVSAPQSTSSYGYASQSSHKPLRTGYEKYKEEPVADLQIDASLWGVAPKKSPQPAQSTTTTSTQPAKKVLSLEEVEAQLRAQAQAGSCSRAGCAADSI
jgi:DNA topoisomerase 2-associated protein PAT1